MYIRGYRYQYGLPLSLDCNHCPGSTTGHLHLRRHNRRGSEIQLRTKGPALSGHLPNPFFGQSRAAFESGYPMVFIASQVYTPPIGRDLFGLAGMKVGGEDARHRMLISAQLERLSGMTLCIPYQRTFALLLFVGSEPGNPVRLENRDHRNLDHSTPSTKLQLHQPLLFCWLLVQSRATASERAMAITMETFFEASGVLKPSRLNDMKPKAVRVKAAITLISNPRPRMSAKDPQKSLLDPGFHKGSGDNVGLGAESTAETG
ncbi:hypothetical protein C8J56DRAFT_907350 [Mycena floridula]|nr:hypothetical protein C8J56DRAFT_907350 [Mycena floridula]